MSYDGCVEVELGMTDDLDTSQVISESDSDDLSSHHHSSFQPCDTDSLNPCLSVQSLAALDTDLCGMSHLS